MGLIDVTDILSDPDFVDSLTLIHRTPIVDEMGQNNLTERKVATIGIVQPASGKTMQRLPDEYRVAGVNSFWIKGAIVSDGKCQYPDVIFYKGQRYQVQTVLDWTSWGQGYCEGTAVREAPTT